jgi:hypothetical protein
MTLALAALTAINNAATKTHRQYGQLNNQQDFSHITPFQNVSQYFYIRRQQDSNADSTMSNAFARLSAIFPICIRDLLLHKAQPMSITH